MIGHQQADVRGEESCSSQTFDCMPRPFAFLENARDQAAVMAHVDVSGQILSGWTARSKGSGSR
jgi:hypothetical protein